MTIDWVYFLPALVLLLTPADLFSGSKVRYRDIMRDWDGYRTRMVAHGMHTIDLVRATLGTWWLLNSVHGAMNPHGFAKYQVVLVIGCIRILAVLIQAVFCRHENSVNAPFAFVIGTLVVGNSPLATLFAIALALPIAIGSRAAAAFFPVVALAHLAIGCWFNGKGALPGLIFGAVAATLPFFWALMFHRDLVVAYRARRPTADSRSPLR